MKKQLLSLCCLLYTLLLCTHATLASIAEGSVQIEPLLEKRETVFPLIAWSDEELFTSKNAQITATLTQADIEDCLFTLLQLRHNVENPKLKDLLESPSAPEVMVIFVEPELGTDTFSKAGDAYSSLDGGDFPNLKAILSNSAASLTAPYVTGSSYSSLLDAPLIHVSEELQQGSVLVVREGDSTTLGLFRQLSGVRSIQVKDLLEYLKTHHEIFTNGVADVIVVAFANSHELAAHDSIIGQVSAYISQATSGKYVGIYTADSPATKNDFVWVFPGHEVDAFLFDDYPFLVSSNGSNYTNTTNTTTTTNYFPGPILEAFMISIPLLTMLFVGTCGIFHLQVPERYEAPKVILKNY